MILLKAEVRVCVWLDKHLRQLDYLSLCLCVSADRAVRESTRRKPCCCRRL